MAKKAPLPDLFAMGFDMMKVVGFHPKQLYVGVVPVLKVGQYFLMSMITMFLCFNEILCSTTLEDALDNTMAFIAFATQGFAKSVIFVLNHRSFGRILDDHVFWQIDDVSDDDLRRELEKTHRTAHGVQKVTRAMFLATLLAICVPILLGQQITPLGTTNCLPRVSEKVGFSVLQVVVMYHLVFMIPGVDIMFLGGCVTLIIQLKIARHFVTRIVCGSDNPAERKEFVETYCRLLAFFEVMKNTYTGLLFFQFLSGVVIICANMYVLMDSTGNQIVYKPAFMYFLICTQQLVYCLMSESVSTHAYAVAEAVYESRWYDNLTKSNGNFIVLTIARAQRPMVFTSFGLFDINHDTFVSIMKLSYTYCTLLRAIKGRQ